MRAFVAFTAVALLPLGCGDDDDLVVPPLDFGVDTGVDTDTGPAPDMGVEDMPDMGEVDMVDMGMADAGMVDAGDQNPVQPALGALIDRSGRAGITTALVATFSETSTRGAFRDAYNVTPRAFWTTTSTLVEDLQGSLAVLDGLDQDCGNQFLADLASPRYSFLSGALVDDRLFVNTATSVCNQYFAVELNVAGALTSADCGGRTPLYDVIDVTYTALATGLTATVSDGVPMDPDPMQPDNGMFPFLAPPVP